MESTGRCLDFRDSTPMDQEFRRRDPNLRYLKAVAVKEVEHLTMVIVMDKDHTHYSVASGIFLKVVPCPRSGFPRGRTV